MMMKVVHLDLLQYYYCCFAASMAQQMQPEDLIQLVFVLLLDLTVLEYHTVSPRPGP